MQESPRVGVRWSIISLNGISYKDAGEYRCQARNMAGISEAPIKLRVVGITRVSKLPRRKSQKTKSKPSMKNTRQDQSSPSTKQNQIFQNTRPPSLNKTKTVSVLAPRPSPKDSWRKTALRLFDLNRKNLQSTSFKPPGPSSTGPALDATARKPEWTQSCCITSKTLFFYPPPSHFFLLCYCVLGKNAHVWRTTDVFVKK